MCIYVYVPICMHTYLPSYLPTYRPTDLPTYLPACYLPIYLSIYLPCLLWATRHPETWFALPTDAAAALRSDAAPLLDAEGAIFTAEKATTPAPLNGDRGPHSKGFEVPFGLIQGRLRVGIIRWGFRPTGTFIGSTRGYWETMEAH